MELEIEFVKDINNIKCEWEKLYNLNCSPTLKFQFVKEYNKTLKQKKYAFVLKSKIEYLIIKNKTGNVLVILPVYRSKKHKKLTSLYLLDYYDVIYDNKLDDNTLKTIIVESLKKINYSITFNLINQSSTLFRLFGELAEDKLACSLLEINENYDNYYEKLSKNTRQNIRTAYNRLKSDNMAYQLCEFDNITMKPLVNDFKKMYVIRRKTKYKNIGKILQILYKFKEPILDSLLKQDNVKAYVLKINEEIAAYMVGLVHGEVLYIPRLVIDDKFKRYSPGMLLILESIKKMKQSNIKMIDLSSGSEEYKSALGAKEHYNYNVIVE